MVQKRKTMRKAYDSSLGQAVHMSIVQRHSKGERISGHLLCEKALELYKTLGRSSDFKASTGWLKIFKSCHGIKNNTESETAKDKDDCDENKGPPTCRIICCLRNGVDVV